MPTSPVTKGKFIVIEGTDGSGKGTQVKLLVDKLKAKDISFEMTDFPQYGNPSSFFVEKYLRGEYGTADEIGAYLGSIFYALDRFDKSFDIRKWLNEGKHIVSNRYISANMGHQAGKIDNLAERDKYLEWLSDLEHRMMGNPKPDAVIFLFVPPEVGQQLVDKKAAREYTQGKKRDIHEADLDHLKKASNAYQYVAKKYGWNTIDCAPDGKLLSIEEVEKLVWNAVSKIIE